MAIMQNDIRRAGYWLNALTTLGANNPFTANNTDLTILDSGTCLLYTYDLNKNGTIENDLEYFGFRLNSNKIEMRVSGSTTTDCHVSDSEWEPVTDPSITNITTLSFDPGNYVCTNLTDSTDVNCVSPNTGDITQTIRLIDISIVGQVSTNAIITRSASDSVRVRNDRLQKI
jgi:type II secretory pathway component PulJ